MIDRAIFFKVMATVQQYFGKNLEQDVLDLYWNSLKQFTLEEFQTASTNIMQEFNPTSAKPFPLIRDFRAMCGKDGETRAVNIISLVKAAAKKYGQYESIDFDDLALHSVIERYGGWPDIVLWSEKDWQFHERNFIAAYKAAQSAKMAGPYYVMGLVEIANRAAGEAVSEPIAVAGPNVGMPRTPISEISREKRTGIPIRGNQSIRDLLSSSMAKYAEVAE